MFVSSDPSAPLLASSAVLIRRLVAALLLSWVAPCLVGPSSASAGPAGEADQLASRFSASRWSTREGLPQNSVTGIMQDQDGYIWLSTFGGLARFDGVRFEVFDLASGGGLEANRFLSIFQDSRGTIWLGTHLRGLVRLREGAFDTIPLPAPYSTANVVDIVEDPAGTVWAATGAGLVSISAGQVRTPGPAEGLPPGPAHALLVDQHGAVWASMSTGVLCVSGACERPLGPLAAGDPYRVDDLALGPDGTLWAASDQGLLRYGEGGSELLVENSGEHSPRAVVDPGTGRVWFSRRGQLYVLDPQGVSTWVRLPALISHGVDQPPRGIRALYLDREGILWVGTDGGGLVQVRDRQLELYGAQQGVRGPSVSAVIEDGSGRIWLAPVCDGLQYLDEGRFRDLQAPGEDIGCVSALAIDAQGELWFADGERLRHYRDGALETWGPGEGLPESRIHALLFDRQGALWIGTQQQGVLRWEHGRVTARYRSQDGLGDDAIYSIAQAPGGALWFGTGAGVAWFADGELHQLGSDGGLSPGAVRDIQLESDGAAWIGTYGGGLTHLLDGVATRITRDSGLCDDVVSRILVVGDDLWMNGNRGVFRVSRADLLDQVQGRDSQLTCTLYESGEGNGGSQPAGWRGSDGRLWFPTIHGVVSIDVGSLHSLSDTAPPLAVIETALVDDLTLDLERINELPPGRGDLVVQFAGLSFVAPEQVQHRHRLLGHDERWVDAGRGRVARYSNLPAGDYRFELAARSAHGIWSEPASLAFTLAPRLYETRRFQLLCLLALFLGVWGMVALRLRRMRVQNRALQREVDERRRVEGELSRREAHYRTLFEGAINGLLLHDREGHLVEVNPAACGLLGLDRDALLAGEELAFVSGEHRPAYSALVAAAVAGERGRSTELLLLAADGAQLEVRLQAAPFDLGGAPHALLSAVDLTSERLSERRRRELEEQLQQAQKMEALGLLAGGIAHDFNNVLTVMKGQAWLLENKLEPGDPARQRALDIQRSVSRAKALTEKLLVFSRRQPHRPEPVDPSQLLTHVIDMLQNLLREDIELVGPRSAHCGPVLMDAGQLEQAVVNLVLNAQDAMPLGGQLTLGVRRERIDEELASQHGAAAGDYVVIEVADTGIGMDEATRARVFEPFFTTKEVGKGTGLGLATVHGAVQEASGFITVQSRPAVGSTFRIHLPRSAGEQQAAGEGPAAGSATFGDPRTARILLCDDDHQVRHTTAQVLEACGYRVWQAVGPEEALSMAKSNVEGGIDLLLTDVVMPVMSGPELARLVIEQAGPLPVLYISGHTRDVVLAQGQMQGEPDLLAKPYTPEELARRVESALAAAREAAGLARPGPVSSGAS